MRHELNLSIGPFTLTEEREEAVAFTVPFAVEKRSILVRSAAASEESAFRMLRPFQYQLWFALAGVIVLVSFTLTFINWLKRDDASLDDGCNKDDYKIASTFWMLFTYHMQQVVINEPRTVIARFLVAFWWMFIILMINYYTATLASTLTITVNVAPIQSLSQLSQPDCEYKPIAIYDSSTYGTFLTSNQIVDKHILKALETAPQVRNSTMALHLTLTDQYAFIAMNSQLDYLKSLYCKELTITLDDTYVYQVGFILPQNSVYTQKLSYGIRKLHEAGLIEKWRHKWWSDSNKCSKQGPHGDPLELWSLAGPYFIYVGFIGLGFIILASEGIFIAFTRRKSKEDINNAT
ncbi:glutamate receptor 2 [Octopus bimaculoides]|nr:glutamate receptor 2 [Octopus bimaculoides]|eukprot:XP_014771816.1 PREDICTED: glutamate receptor 2-like [Octopus bimaculoides]